METESLQDIPEFGSLDYDLDRAVDRLICITTLIRNFSFYEANFNVLGMSEVVRFLTNVIRHLGTKEMLLRTNRNTLDFMKDVIIYLSNLSHSIQLPGKEEALCLLHFLLSFAPCPPPITASSDKITFTMYNPNIHKYTPSAVDSLAKLLARDEPNRTYYKSIYSADAASSPYELLTRTFGLAISPLPVATMNPRAIVGARKPFLLQGMLAAEILSNLAPGSDHGLARSWLESTDGFAVSLLRLVGLLSAEHRPQPPQRHPQGGRGAPELDADAYGAITHRAMAVLKRLVEKSRNGENADFRLPPGIIPKKETLLGALVTKEIDAQVLKQLCTYSALDE
jgi:SWI/SNF chromatin-remodeling complex subunit SWI1